MPQAMTGGVSCNAHAPLSTLCTRFSPGRSAESQLKSYQLWSLVLHFRHPGLAGQTAQMARIADFLDRRDLADRPVVHALHRLLHARVVAPSQAGDDAESLLPGRLRRLP